MAEFWQRGPVKPASSLGVDFKAASDAPYYMLGAILDGPYRYELTRAWDPDRPWLAWVMLNPSTADSYEDDPTIRRCVDFAKRWGYGGIVVVNLYAYRATSPDDLEVAARNGLNTVGSENEEWLRRTLERYPAIAAWGVNAGLAGDLMRAHLRDGHYRLPEPVRCLGVTKHGHPRHPLYVAASTPPIPFLREAS